MYHYPVLPHPSVCTSKFKIYTNHQIGSEPLECSCSSAYINFMYSSENVLHLLKVLVLSAYTCN